ncbi:MAG: exopolysaccharide biosynthesis polyprenyl glycosylphosphotransferase [Bacteroidia bacterium]|nr:exopolysaccharide biosynthesis polyprenyl glycosylphosphotransferase [Bacteroidia bacterium]
MSKKNSKVGYLLLIFFDILVINLLTLVILDFGNEKIFFFPIEILNNKSFLYFIYSTISWLSISSFLNYYKPNRLESAASLIVLQMKQFFAFSICVFGFIGLFRSIDVEALITIRYLIVIFAAISLFKVSRLLILKSFGHYAQSGIKKIIIVGDNQSSRELKDIVTKRKELGYDLKGTYTRQGKGSGTIEDAIEQIASNRNLDEIYCAIDKLDEAQVNEFIRLSSLYDIDLKFITQTDNYRAKRLETQYYDYLPVLSIQKASLNKPANKFIKRIFDIVFSLLIITLILSWLLPLLGILIKLESKGPIFFKHKRNGIDYKKFTCYKFRSLRESHSEEVQHVMEDDKRVTSIGRFIRKTSIDELPQFFNVLLGQMSVVGPRPHMLSYTDAYSKKIDKYRFAFRHSVKPGITGLAQIKGYRGEIRSDEDIINRIKYDIFYIENWSLLLDLKIILQTFFNALKGEEKAY